jgi:hypothetical protein
MEPVEKKWNARVFRNVKQQQRSTPRFVNLILDEVQTWSEAGARGFRIFVRESSQFLSLGVVVVDGRLEHLQ